MVPATLLLLSLPFATGKTTFTSGPSGHKGGLDTTDCQLRCPKSNELNHVVLPAITHVRHKTGKWENTLECWSVNTTTFNMPGVDNAFRLDWEKGFDAAYQYIFYGVSFMPAHSTPEPSLAIMSAGIGDVKVPSGRCLRIGPGDIFFNVGTQGLQTAWFSQGSVVTDLYFKNGEVPDHKIVPELKATVKHATPNRGEL
ncbi:hypothetical protein F4777DRAFT_562968 [Nemania sp. FL0916]|nr:hypothetical protein F4777DRAFT_562968 [Nemania sp. FL0916]